MASWLMIFSWMSIYQANVMANPGHRFILTFPQNDHTGVDNYVQLTPELKSYSSIQVTVQGVNSNFQLTVPVNHGNLKRVTIPPSFRLAAGCFKSANQTLLIQASHPITVTVRSVGWSNIDSFVVLPVDQLGSQYYTFTYQVINSTATSAFFVVAAESQATNITITLSKVNEMIIFPLHVIDFNDVQYLPGDVIQIDLEPYEAVQIQASYDLTGSRIDSSHPVAVWSGLNRTKVERTCWSHAVQMLPPSDKFGDKYVLAPSPVASPITVYRIITRDWLTRVTIYQPIGTPLTYILPSPGSYVSYTSTVENSFEYLEATGNVTVARYIASRGQSFLGDSALTVLAPLGSVRTSHYRIGQQRLHAGSHLFTLILSRDRVDSITMEGDPITNVLSYQTSVSLYNVTHRVDLIALVLNVTFPVFWNTFAIWDEPGFPFMIYVDLIGNCEAETFPQAYSQVSTYTSQPEVSHQECLAIDEENSTHIFVPESSRTDGCCVKGNQICQCKTSEFTTQMCHTNVTTTDNRCKLLSEKREASSNSTVAAPNLLMCRRQCDSSPSCIGFNFAPNLPTSHKCQLLIGQFQGLIHDGVWRHMHCFTRSTFYVHNCIF